MMRVLICGDRDWTDEAPMRRLVAHLGAGDVVIEGEARGADKMARRLAEEAGVPVVPCPAEWDRYGRAAGPIRNRRMLTECRPDIVVAFHDDLFNSKGTRNMMDVAGRAGIPVWLFADGRCTTYHD